MVSRPFSIPSALVMSRRQKCHQTYALERFEESVQLKKLQSINGCGSRDTHIWCLYQLSIISSNYHWLYSWAQLKCTLQETISTSATSIENLLANARYHSLENYSQIRYDYWTKKQKIVLSFSREEGLQASIACIKAVSKLLEIAYTNQYAGQIIRTCRLVSGRSECCIGAGTAWCRNC